MIKGINHYSIENTPTVYDEEALTALQLIARVTGKLNEVIGSYNAFKNLTAEQLDELRNLIGTGGGGTNTPGTDVPDVPGYDPKPEEPEEPETKNDYAIVYPSGDISGVDDLAAIQDNVSTKKIVILAPGEYYLAAPIIADAGVTISGCGITNTVVNCAEGFITHEVDNSIDHLTLRDVWVKGKGSGIGVNIARVNAEAETGGRYSYFENVRISEFSTGVDMTACWCVQFNHCRFEACSFGVIQGHTCNNITFNHCQFLGTNDSTGLFINSEGGAQSCGTHVVNCDFERHKIGVRAYCAVSLVIHNIYCEGTTDVIKLDSCPGFLCDGGYISFPGNLVLSTQRTNELPFYANSSGVLKNIFVQYNSDNDCYIMTASGGMPIKTEGINAYNAGTGTVWVDSQFTYSRANGHEYHDRFVYKMYNGKVYAPNFSNKNHVKLVGGCFVFKDSVDVGRDTEIFVVSNTVGRGLLKFTLTAGHHAANSRVNGVFAIDIYRNYISKNAGNLSLTVLNQDSNFNWDTYMDCIELEFATGEMICSTNEAMYMNRSNGGIITEMMENIAATPAYIPLDLEVM